MLAQSAGKSELDGTAQETSQEALESGQVDHEEAGGGSTSMSRSLSLDGSASPRAGGAEQRQANDVAPSDGRGVGAQQRKDALAERNVTRRLGFRRARHGVDIVAQI